MSNPAEKSFVLFPLGSKRFALPAETVSELAIPDRLQIFPHRSPLLTGVLVRRGRIIPVCDVALVLMGPSAPVRKFYLIAVRNFDARQERTAIPVTGECELASLEQVAHTQKLPPYISGLLNVDEEIIEIVDLDKIKSEEAAA